MQCRISFCNILNAQLPLNYNVERNPLAWSNSFINLHTTSLALPEYRKAWLLADSGCYGCGLNLLLYRHRNERNFKHVEDRAGLRAPEGACERAEGLVLQVADERRPQFLVPEARLDALEGLEGY